MMMMMMIIMMMKATLDTRVQIKKVLNLHLTKKFNELCHTAMNNFRRYQSSWACINVHIQTYIHICTYVCT